MIQKLHWKELHSQKVTNRNDYLKAEVKRLKKVLTTTKSKVTELDCNLQKQQKLKTKLNKKLKKAQAALVKSISIQKEQLKTKAAEKLQWETELNSLK